MTEEITTTHLVMDSLSSLRPRSRDDADIMVVLQNPPNAQMNHALFMEIGTPYRWFSRLDWEIGDWEGHVNDQSVQTWLGMKGGAPFGYYELQHRNDGAGPSNHVGPCTEITFFGLYAAFTGQGLGGHLLTHAVAQAWAVPGTKQVYVHTCTADHPAALANYLARGFRIDRAETEMETIPDLDDPIWSSPEYYRSLMSRQR